MALGYRPVSDHTVLGIILGASIAGELFAAIWIVKIVRESSQALARLLIQETNKIPGKLTVRE